MPRAATASPSPSPLDRPAPAREALRLGWAPTRRIAPMGPTAEAEPDPRLASAPVARSPKSPPPLKGQTGPRPGY